MDDLIEAEDFEKALGLPVRQDVNGQIAQYNPDELVFMDFGACRNEHPDLYVTDTNHGRTSMRGHVRVDGVYMRKSEQIARAKAVCLSCPVLDECREFIARYPEDEGIWAGLLPEERKGVIETCQRTTLTGTTTRRS